MLNHRLAGSSSSIIPSRAVSPSWVLAVAFFGVVVFCAAIRILLPEVANKPLFSSIQIAAHALTAALIIHAVFDLVYLNSSFHGMTQKWVSEKISESRLVANPPYIIAAFRDVLSEVLEQVQVRWIRLYLISLIVALIGFIAFVGQVRLEKSVPLEKAPFELLLVPVGECIMVAAMLACASAWARRRCSAGEQAIAQHVTALYDSGAVARLVDVPALTAEDIVKKESVKSSSGSVSTGFGEGENPFESNNENPFESSNENPFESNNENPFDNSSENHF